MGDRAAAAGLPHCHHVGGVGDPLKVAAEGGACTAFGRAHGSSLQLTGTAGWAARGGGNDGDEVE